MNYVNRNSTKERLARMFAMLLLICVMSATTVSAYAAEIPNATQEFYVNDFAGVFSSAQKEELLVRAEALAAKPEGVQVVISTVKSLDGKSVDNYAYDMYNKYEIGLEDRGVLILLSTTDREYRVEIGYGLHSYLTASKASQFVTKYALSYWKESKFAEGLIELQKAMIKDLDNHFESLRKTAAPAITSEPVTRSYSNERPIAVVNTEAPKTSKASATAVPTSIGDGGTKSPNLFLITSIVELVLLFICAVLLYESKKKYEESEEQVEQLEENLETAEASIAEINAENKSQLAKLRADHARELKRVSDKLQADKTSMNSDWARKYKDLERRLEAATTLGENLQKELDNLRDRYSRAVKIHTALDSEVDYMIQKEIDEANKRVADNFDQQYQHLSNVVASPQIDFAVFRKAFSDYERLSKQVHVFVQTDMEKLHQIFDQSYEMLNRKLAQDFMNSARGVCARIHEGTEANLPELRGTLEKYNMLAHDSKQYVDPNMIGTLNKLVRQGEDARDKRIAREEEERKERERKRAAQAFEDSANEACQRDIWGKEENITRFEDMIQRYNGMSRDVQRYVDSSLIATLEERVRHGRRERAERIEEERRERERKEEERRKREREEEEERERRRRSESFSSFSSSHHSGGSSSSSIHINSGFGGHSGGGGVSGKF